MWRIPLQRLEDSELEEYIQLALTYDSGEAVYPITPDERSLILSLYKQYDAASGLPSAHLKAAHYPAPLLEAIKNAYTEMQQGRRLGVLRERLLQQTSLCPYCGFGEVRDLDHYLPKARYYGLSIYPQNLIPCCAICNGKKGTIDKFTPNKQFHHAYFGYLPNEIFFIADVHLQDGALVANFRIDNTGALLPDTYERLKFQIERLELNDRYTEIINSFLCSLETSLMDAFGEAEDAEMVRDYLVRTAVSHSKSFGQNDWRPALLRGLSTSSEFCEGGFKSALGRIQPSGA